MVCKEDVLLWFKDLEGYKRLDVMYELLNMCVPFEVRFLGSCIEEIGKHSYQELRGSAIIANDIDKLTKDSTLTQGLLNEGVRHRVLIYLSLLSSSNCKCANWFYKTLLRTEWVESCVLRGNVKDDNLQSELLLLFTMGLYHPAFTFDQKHFFGNMLAHVIEQKEYKKHFASKPFISYNPGMGCNQTSTIISHDTAHIPVKTSPVYHSDQVPHAQQNQSMIPHPIAAPPEVMQVWTRPGFIRQVHPPPECTHVRDDKVREPPWLNPVMVRLDMKPPNGMRFPTYSKVPEDYCIGQMQALNLDVDNSPQCCSSSSSSTNSLNQSPPDTPTVPTVPHHGPGRGDTKSRINGVQQQYANTGHPNVNIGLPVCDKTPLPQPAPSLNNCSVPYSNYPPQVTLTAIPNRSVYQPYRPPFSTPFNYPAPPEMFSYTYPYFFLSSTPSQLPNRTSNCFNCGAVSHTGADCNGQTVEDITQKKAYTLEYNLPLPNVEK